MSAFDVAAPGPPDAPATPAPAPRLRPRGGWLEFGEGAALIVLTLLLALFFTLLPATSDTFPTTANLRVVVLSESVLLVVAMAALIPLICREYDFSVGATTGLTSVLAASVVSGGDSLVVAIVVAAAVGLGIGLVNGLLVTLLRVDSVVVTLGMTTIVAGLVTWKTDGQSVVSGIPDALKSVSDALVLGIPRAFFIALAFVALTYYLLRHTPFGRYLHAIGSNPSAARLVGLRTGGLTLTAFLLAGLIAGLAGVLQVGVAGSANPQVGPNYTLPAIAAAFLSVAAIKPGRFNVWGTLVAIAFLAVLNSGLNLAGVDPYVNDFANGGALIVGVALAAVLGRRRNADRT